MPVSRAAQVMGGGYSAGQVLALNGTQSATTFAAAGTTQGTATSITAASTYVGTAAASSGVVLPSSQPGDEFLIYNGGANALTVYPHSGGKVNGLSTNTGFLLGTNTAVRCYCHTTTQWIAMLSA